MLPDRENKSRRAVLAAIVVALSPIAHAEIGATGDVSPITITPPPPVTGTVSGVLGVGQGATGTLTVDGGSSLTANALSVANNGADGQRDRQHHRHRLPARRRPSISRVRPSGGLNPLEVGNFGNGTMTVSQGAIVNVALGNTNCSTNPCGTFIGNAAGSTARLTLTGSGTTMNLSAGSSSATPRCSGSLACRVEPPTRRWRF